MAETLAQKIRAKYPGAYNDLSDTELEAKVKAKYPGAYDDLPTTSTQPEAPRDRSALESVGAAIGGAAHELNPLTIAEGLYNTVRHPIDTVKNIGSAHLDQAQKAVEAAKAGRYSEAYGHAMATLIPLLGPAAANIGEEIAATGDVARGVGRTAGLLTAVEAPAIARGVVTAASKTGLTATLAELADKGAAKRVVDVIAPKVGANKTRFGNMAADVAPAIAEEPGLNAISRSSLGQKVSGRLAEAETALDEAADARNAGRAYTTKPIIDALLEKRRALTAEPVEGSLPERATSSRLSPILDERGKPIEVVKQKAQAIGEDVVPSPNASRVAQIDKAIAELKQLGPIARYESIRRVRQAYDGPAKAVYSPAVTADYMTAQGSKLGAADVTGTLRDKLATYDPKTAKANADYSIWRKANDVLEAAEEVERTRPTVGRKIAARFGGAVAGEAAAGSVGAAIGVLLGPIVDGALSTGVTTKVITARALTALAKALRSGDAGAIESALKPVRAASVAFGKQPSPAAMPALAPSYADQADPTQVASR
jgi:hypothetical protein